VSECGANLNALLLIGSIRLFGENPTLIVTSMQEAPEQPHADKAEHRPRNRQAHRVVKQPQGQTGMPMLLQRPSQNVTSHEEERERQGRPEHHLAQRPHPPRLWSCGSWAHGLGLHRTPRMSHEEEREKGIGLPTKRKRAPPHWLNPLVKRPSLDENTCFQNERGTKMRSPG
jgi:hypothetical protein